MLRVALLTYRGNPFSGGQGVYVRCLSRELTELGHHVEVLSGPPYPHLAEGVGLTRLPSLELYRPEEPFRAVHPARGWIDRLELASFRTGGYPEPLAFSLRARSEILRRRREFDVVHDNQSLGYGLLAVRRHLPTLATVHHPIDIDLRAELARAAGNKRLALRRWYSFTRMQARVARRLPRLLAVSEAARRDIVAAQRVAPRRVRTIPLGVDPQVFKPPDEPRSDQLVLATVSSGSPLKGLAILLQAMEQVCSRRQAELVVVGRRPSGFYGPATFVEEVDEAELVRLYGRAALAVVPSLYEGFSLPAVEAMACGTPLLATTAGALPEVVGDGGRLVPPGEPGALAAAICELLGDGERRRRLGEAGRRRVLAEFSWRRTAERTAEVYGELAERR